MKPLAKRKTYITSRHLPTGKWRVIEKIDYHEDIPWSSKVLAEFGDDDYKKACEFLTERELKEVL